jgi:hypothetical protein
MEKDMKYKSFIIIGCFLQAAAVHAAPGITSIEVIDDTAGTIDISGSDFGTHADNGSGVYMPRLWDNFESGNFDNWMFRVGGTSWEISSDYSRADSNYSAHKLNVTPLDSMQIRPASRSEYYTSFWMYLSSGTNWRNNNKYFRAGDTATKKNLVWHTNLNSRRTQTTLEYAVGGTKVDYGSQSTAALQGSWNFVEVMWGLPVLGNSNNYAQVYVNGKLVNELSDENGLWLQNEEMTKSPYISLGTWFSREYGIGGGWYYDDVYIDYTLARVVLGNAPDYSNCTHLEMQLPRTWSDESIRIDINKGSFEEDDTVYLFVIDEDNTPSAGYPVDLANLDDLPNSTDYSYTILNPRLTSSTVVSLVDNNVITAGNTTLNLDRYEWGGIEANTGDITQGVVVTGTGPFEIGSGTPATDVPVLSSLAGTQFAMPHHRYQHWYYMVSPDADATVQISIDDVDSVITLPQGVAMDFDAGETNTTISAVITSDTPILVSHMGDPVDKTWFADASPVPPAATELWGFRSSTASFGAVEDDTHVTLYASDGTTSTMTLDAGQKRWVNVGDRTQQGQGSAIHLVADKPIGAIQIADGDGADQTAFFPTSLLSTRFGLPENAQYIAVACPEEDTSVTLYNGNNDPITRTCSANGNYPGKAYFGSAEKGVVGAQQGAYLESDKPIHVIYEVSASEDEHNLMGTLEP